MRFLFIPFGLGCAEEKISELIDGEFEFRSIHGEDNGVTLPAGLSLTVSGTEITISSDDGTIYNGTVNEKPEEEWMENCFTNASSTSLKTYTLDTAFSIDGVDYTTPLIVPGCDGTTVNLSEDGSYSDEHTQCAEGTCLYFVME